MTLLSAMIKIPKHSWSCDSVQEMHYNTWTNEIHVMIFTKIAERHHNRLHNIAAIPYENLVNHPNMYKGYKHYLSRNDVKCVISFIKKFKLKELLLQEAI